MGSMASRRPPCTPRLNGWSKTAYTSYWGADGPGARRRYYAITDQGRRQWADNIAEWEHTRALLDALISVEEEH